MEDAVRKKPRDVSDELARRFADRGIVSGALDSGSVFIELQRHSPFIADWMLIVCLPLHCILRRPIEPLIYQKSFFLSSAIWGTYLTVGRDIKGGTHLNGKVSASLYCRLRIS